MSEIVSEHEAIRRQKLDKLKEMGIEPYGEKYPVTHYAADIIGRFDSLDGQKVSLAGRLMTVRAHGKASFANLQDESGQIQIYVRLDDVGEQSYDVFELLDIGDIVGISGDVFRTRRGEVTVAVKELRLLSKSLRPLPEKWHGLTNVDLRYRQRYLDLIVNPEAKNFLHRVMRLREGIRY